MRSTTDDGRVCERLFTHWVFILEKNPKRCALGPARRKLIGQALALYDEETLRLAIEGCASSAWHAGHNDGGTEYQDLGLIFRDGARVERFAAMGTALRRRVRAKASGESSLKPPPPTQTMNDEGQRCNAGLQRTHEKSTVLILAASGGNVKRGAVECPAAGGVALQIASVA